MSSVRTAVLPVAGLGTRFLPVTKSVPKEMLPVVDRPCIEYIVTEAVEAGIENIVFVTARGKDAILDYFDRAPALERYLEEKGKTELLQDVRRVATQASVVAVRQGEALGLGHAVMCARPAVGQQAFAVLLGDDIMDAPESSIGGLCKVHAERGGAVVGLIVVPREHTSRYGICAGTWVRKGVLAVAEMVEKPAADVAPSCHAIVGRYVLPPEIFDILASTPKGTGGEIQLTDALAVLARRGCVTGVEMNGERFDTGNPLGLLRASIHFALRKPELRADLLAMLEHFLTENESSGG